MNEKIGIIDVGGGMKDIYGAGVLDYLLDNKIYIPYCIGISAGSANMASYVARQRGRNIDFYKKYNVEKEAMSLKNLIRLGSYINLDYIYGTLSNEGGKSPIDYETMMESSSDLIVVASRADTGEPEYFYKKDFKKNQYGFCCASSCLPIVCKPYEYNGKKYYDGSITNPIPIKKAFEDGCSKVIIILTRPEDYRKSDTKKKNAYKSLEKQYPEFTQKLYKRCELYNTQLDEIIKNIVPTGKALIVAPDDCCGVDTLTKDTTKLDELYNKGYEDGIKIKNFIKK